jgi:hypothetical protein
MSEKSIQCDLIGTPPLTSWHPFPLGIGWMNIDVTEMPTLRVYRREWTDIHFWSPCYSYEFVNQMRFAMVCRPITAFDRYPNIDPEDPVVFWHQKWDKVVIPVVPSCVDSTTGKRRGPRQLPHMLPNTDMVISIAAQETDPYLFTLPIAGLADGRLDVSLTEVVATPPVPLLGLSDVGMVLAFQFPWRNFDPKLQIIQDGNSKVCLGADGILWLFMAPMQLKGSHWRRILTHDTVDFACLIPFENNVPMGNVHVFGVANPLVPLEQCPQGCVRIKVANNMFTDVIGVDLTNDIVRRCTLTQMHVQETCLYGTIGAYEKAWGSGNAWSRVQPDIMREIISFVPSTRKNPRVPLEVPCLHVSRYPEGLQKVVKIEDHKFREWDGNREVFRRIFYRAWGFGAPGYVKPPITGPVDTVHSGVTAPWFSVVLAATDTHVVGVHFIA